MNHAKKGNDMTNTHPQGQVPEALLLADACETGHDVHPNDLEKIADELRRLHAQVAALTAAPTDPMPSWMHYDSRNDVLTIHSKRYAAAMFGQDGFLAPVGTLLRAGYLKPLSAARKQGGV